MIGHGAFLVAASRTLAAGHAGHGRPAQNPAAEESGNAHGALPKHLHAVRPIDRHIAKSLTPPSPAPQISGGHLDDVPSRQDPLLDVGLADSERGGYLGYSMWGRYLALAQGYTATHKDGMVKYTAHELRHVCASLLIASGATDMQVTNQMGHRKIETTKNIYGHLFAQDRSLILTAMNQAVTRLYVQDDEKQDEQAA